MNDQSLNLLKNEAICWYWCCWSSEFPIWYFIKTLSAFKHHQIITKFVLFFLGHPLTSHSRMETSKQSIFGGRMDRLDIGCNFFLVFYFYSLQVSKKIWIKLNFHAYSFNLLFNQILYRVSENEGQTEKGYKTLKIGGLDHLFGISVIYI